MVQHGTFRAAKSAQESPPAAQDRIAIDIHVVGGDLPGRVLETSMLLAAKLGLPALT